MSMEDRMARIWCELNAWEWPKELGSPRPSDDRHRNMLISVVFKLVDNVAGDAGLALWRQRIEANDKKRRSK